MKYNINFKNENDLLLHQNGYIILKNVLDNNEIQYGLSAAHSNDHIDYDILRNFIDKYFFQAIIHSQTTITDPIYCKFRFSNSANSKDASTFHGDIYNHNQNLQVMPIYTCLCYFDNSTMELIPGSHIPNNNLSLTNYKNRKTVELTGGDILVFHANIQHRGKNFYKNPNRRLLQVFEVFPNKNVFNQYFNNLIIVQSSTSTFMNYITEFCQIFSHSQNITDCFAFFHYFLVNNDLQYKITMMDVSPNTKKNNFISYEPGKRIDWSKLSEITPHNINIICAENMKTIGTSNYYMWYYIIYLITLSFLFYYIYKKGGMKKIKKFYKNIFH